MLKGDFSFSDDSVTVLLDPHNGGRSGYMFDLNPHGNRNEALFADVTTENWAWQGTWHGAARKDSEGWIAEIEIPFKTLSFDSYNETWGFNHMRWRAREGEFSGWVSHNGSMNPASSGKLQGIIGIGQGLGLDIVPAIRITESQDFTTSQSSMDLEPSIDVFYKLRSALTAALTVNTETATARASLQSLAGDRTVISSS